MADLKEYAWLSELVYKGLRTSPNDLELNKGIGDEWHEKKYISDNPNQNSDATDFSAGVYQKGNEIVIAFTDTNVGMHEHIETSLPAANGFPTDQVEQALDLVMEILREYPNANTKGQ